MTRTLLAILAGLILCTLACGCGSSDPEDEQMEQTRESPPPRKPPGARPPGGLEGDEDDGGE
ncbi:MAG: hypothetical protein GY715_12975 [Planctomycetes bacterium]|nr:hypothetical protein [Planctomycetota bacterium]